MIRRVIQSSSLNILLEEWLIKTRRFFITILSLLFSFGFASALPSYAVSCELEVLQSAPGKPWNSIGFTKTEKALLNRKILRIKLLKDFATESGKKPSGTSPTFLVELEGGLLGVWKVNSWGDADYEVDAYKFARLIKSRQVPPTVKRPIPKEEFHRLLSSPHPELTSYDGSLQYFVRSKIDLLDGHSHNYLKKVSAKDLSDKAVFYFVFGQWDNHSGNLIIDDTYTQALIDNSCIGMRTQIRYGELPFRRIVTIKATDANRGKVGFGTEFPFDQVQYLTNPTPEDIVKFAHGEVTVEQVMKSWGFLKTEGCKYGFILWNDMLWAQKNIWYKPAQTAIYSEATLSQYRALTFEKLRAVAHHGYSDGVIYDVLARRDQVLAAAVGAPRIP